MRPMDQNNNDGNVCLVFTLDIHIGRYALTPAWREVRSGLCFRASSVTAVPTPLVPWRRNPHQALEFHERLDRRSDLDLTTSKRDTTYTRQIPTRYVRTTRRGATVNHRDKRSRRPRSPRRRRPPSQLLEALANTRFRTDGRPQVPRGAAKEEAERCHALSAPRSLLGGTTHHHLKKSDIRRFVRLCLGVLVEHLLRVLSYSSAS